MASNSDSITIRKGTPADADTLCNLIIALAECERIARPDKAAQDRLKRDAFGAQPRFDCWLAEVNGQPIGYAITFHTYSTFLALPSLYLEDIFVLPEFRMQKVGKALFLHCAKFALEQGCGRMEWQVLHWMTPAIDFYRGLGAQRLEGWQPYRIVRRDLERIVV
jgi:GNAT superfamily N-acetyltransferase